LNRSAIRPDVRLRHAWYAEHKNILGSCPDYLILDSLTPVRIGNPDEPSTMWEDYQDKTTLPESVLSRIDNIVDLVNL
jgi:CRISPR-associated protein Csd2